jgi:hypothetical protein
MTTNKVHEHIFNRPIYNHTEDLSTNVLWPPPTARSVDVNASIRN